MKSILLSALLILGSFSSSLRAQEKDAAEVIIRGFTALQKDGTLAAIDTWLAGSAREADDNFQDLVAGRMNRVQGFFGRPIGFEVIRWVPLSASTKRLYLAAKFEKGVAWMSFDCYKPNQDWIVTRLDFHTNANLVLPPGILAGPGSSQPPIR